MAEAQVTVTSFVDLLPIALEAVDLATEMLRTRAPGEITSKGHRDMATDLDFAIEQEVRRFLQDRTPHIGFIGEEEGTVRGDAELMWVLDPIDGTANFIHGIPLYGVSLGLLFQDRAVLGVIDLPMLGQRYHAVEGLGAVGPSGPLACSRTDQLADAIVAIGDYAVGEDAASRNTLRLAITALLAARVQRVRMHGSVAVDLAWLAAGRVDAMIAISNKPWDMTAGVAIAREAGALVLDVEGQPHSLSSTATIATNRPLAKPVVGLIHDAETATAP